MEDALDEIRNRVLERALQDAPFDGWSDALLSAAAAAAGVSPAEALLGFPQGVLDLLDYFALASDRDMADKFAALDPAPEKIRDKITSLVRLRLDVMAPHKEAARKAAARLALPDAAARGARMAARTADAMWRAIDDPSTDFNYYSKRAILTGVYLSTAGVWLNDDDPDQSRSWAFLDARIENVMQFEKLKRTVAKAPLSPVSLLNGLARIRYPGRAAS